jgi:signal peptidase I
VIGIVGAILAVVAVVAVVATLYARRFLLVVMVDGASMEPSYHHGDRLLARRCGTKRVRRGDVLVLQGVIAGYDVEQHVRSGRSMQELPRAGHLIIKRVAATPGDRVPPVMATAVHPVTDVTVPAGRYLVLGDNPRESADSRVFGYVTGAQIVAVIVRPLQRR